MRKPMNPMFRWLKVVVLAVVLMPLLAMHAAPPPVEQTVTTRPTAGQAAGRVVDENGEPLIGATVAVIGTGVTTATAVDGHFTLPLPADDCMLQFTYVGYAAQKLAPGPQMHVQMMPGNNALSEVVVTALGIKREAKALSYHVQQVENDAIMRVQDANFVNSLTGKLAGVQINANASGIGGSSRVVMRGAKSIDGNNNVLYVIDGVPLVNAQSGLDDDALAFSGLKSRSVLLMLFIMPMWINFTLRLTALKEILTLIEGNLAFHPFLNSVIGMTYDFLPFMIMPIYNQLERMDKSLIEAATDLGADAPGCFMRITLPLSMPGVMSGVAMVFLPAMTNYVVLDMLYNSTYIMGSLIGSYFSAYDWHGGSMISLILLALICIFTLLTKDEDGGDVRGGSLI